MVNKSLDARALGLLHYPGAIDNDQGGDEMLTGERVVLRAQNREDLAQRHAELGEDYALHAVTDGGAWRPEGLEATMARWDKRLGEPVETGSAWFSVARKDDPELAWIGMAGLWDINDHARIEYNRNTYGVDPLDLDYFHLRIDSTALDTQTCVDVIVTASQSRLLSCR
jgi:RimJ/RimL family protein N-acetyltransferase